MADLIEVLSWINEISPAHTRDRVVISFRIIGSGNYSYIPEWTAYAEDNQPNWLQMTQADDGRNTEEPIFVRGMTYATFVWDATADGVRITSPYQTHAFAFAMRDISCNPTAVSMSGQMPLPYVPFYPRPPGEPFPPVGQPPGDPGGPILVGKDPYGNRITLPPSNSQSGPITPMGRPTTRRSVGTTHPRQRPGPTTPTNRPFPPVEPPGGDPPGTIGSVNKTPVGPLGTPPGGGSGPEPRTEPTEPRPPVPGGGPGTTSEGQPQAPRPRVGDPPDPHSNPSNSVEIEGAITEGRIRLPNFVRVGDPDPYTPVNNSPNDPYGTEIEPDLQQQNQDPRVFRREPEQLVSTTLTELSPHPTLKKEPWGVSWLDFVTLIRPRHVSRGENVVISTAATNTHDAASFGLILQLVVVSPSNVWYEVYTNKYIVLPPDYTTHIGASVNGLDFEEAGVWRAIGIAYDEDGETVAFSEERFTSYPLGTIAGVPAEFAHLYLPSSRDLNVVFNPTTSIAGFPILLLPVLSQPNTSTLGFPGYGLSVQSTLGNTFPSVRGEGGGGLNVSTRPGPSVGIPGQRSLRVTGTISAQTLGLVNQGTSTSVSIRSAGTFGLPGDPGSTGGITVVSRLSPSTSPLVVNSTLGVSVRPSSTILGLPSNVTNVTFTSRSVAPVTRRQQEISVTTIPGAIYFPAGSGAKSLVVNVTQSQASFILNNETKTSAVTVLAGPSTLSTVVTSESTSDSDALSDQSDDVAYQGQQFSTTSASTSPALGALGELGGVPIQSSLAPGEYYLLINPLLRPISMEVFIGGTGTTLRQPSVVSTSTSGSEYTLSLKLPYGGEDYKLVVGNKNPRRIRSDVTEYPFSTRLDGTAEVSFEGTAQNYIHIIRRGPDGDFRTTRDKILSHKLE